MQLTKRGAVSFALTQASAALLGVVPLSIAQAADSDWQVDAATLIYNESGGRVQAVEPVINLSKDYGGERVLSWKLVLDSLTGASPNGAAPADKVQTFTSPSGRGEGGENGEPGELSTYSVAAGELPLDSAFKDIRAAISLGWQHPLSSDMHINMGANISTELDFTSLGFNTALAKDINSKNTTFSVGLNAEFDNIKPTGGAPMPLTAMADQLKNGSESRHQVDFLIGMTQILGRHSLLQLNYDQSDTSGYQTDPYKVLTVLDSNYNLVLSDTANQFQYLFEKRPDTRSRHGLYAEWKTIFTEDVLDLSYRKTSDDWGIKSSTIDAKYRWSAGEKLYLEPHWRRYTQTAADFYKPYLLAGQDVGLTGNVVTPLITEASADSRLGAFDAVTYGIKLGYTIRRDSEISLRLERYQQTANSPDAPAVGDLAGQKMAPDLSANWLQLSYSFRW